MATCYRLVHPTPTRCSQSFGGPEEGTILPKVTQQVRQLCLKWINPKLKPSKHPYFSDQKTKAQVHVRAQIINISATPDPAAVVLFSVAPTLVVRGTASGDVSLQS